MKTGWDTNFRKQLQISRTATALCTRWYSKVPPITILLTYHVHPSKHGLERIIMPWKVKAKANRRRYHKLPIFPTQRLCRQQSAGSACMHIPLIFMRIVQHDTGSAVGMPPWQTSSYKSPKQIVWILLNLKWKLPSNTWLALLLSFLYFEKNAELKCSLLYWNVNF